jgi:hypothetical protein
VEGGGVNPSDFSSLSIMSTELSMTNPLFNNTTIFNLVLTLQRRRTFNSLLSPFAGGFLNIKAENATFHLKCNKSRKTGFFFQICQALCPCLYIQGMTINSL